MPNSRGLDACDSGLATDINNRTRPYGARYDMGAYEGAVRQVFLPVVARE
jgi:hypothetical protein